MYIYNSNIDSKSESLTNVTKLFDINLRLTSKAVRTLTGLAVWIVVTTSTGTMDAGADHGVDLKEKRLTVTHCIIIADNGEIIRPSVCFTRVGNNVVGPRKIFYLTLCNYLDTFTSIYP